VKQHKFINLEEACENSRYRRAVGRLGKIRHNGNDIPVEVVKYHGGDGFIVFSGTGVKVRRATTSEIDSVKVWRPW